MRDGIALRSRERAVTAAVVLAVGVSVALAGVVLALSSRPADAAPRVLTKSFTNSKEIKIPKGAPGTTSSGTASPYPSAVTSSFPRGSKVRDVNVTLRNFTHTYPDDVDVLLVHGGKNRTIFSDVGGDLDVDDITIKLDDETANGRLPDLDQLVGGVFIPTNVAEGIATDFFDPPAPDPASAKSALSGFDGSSARGSWKLFVVDESDGDNGTIRGGWTLQIKAAVPR